MFWVKSNRWDEHWRAWQALPDNLRECKLQNAPKKHPCHFSKPARGQCHLTETLVLLLLLLLVAAAENVWFHHTQAKSIPFLNLALIDGDLHLDAEKRLLKRCRHFE